MKIQITILRPKAIQSWENKVATYERTIVRNGWFNKTVTTKVRPNKKPLTR